MCLREHVFLQLSIVNIVGGPAGIVIGGRAVSLFRPCGLVHAICTPVGRAPMALGAGDAGGSGMRLAGPPKQAPKAGARSFAGNPFDGHILSEQFEPITNLR